jgi:hypothetical protein
MSNEGAARLISELCDRADTREEELCTELAKVKERVAELEGALEWNHSVSVCREHTGDIVGGPCVICELAEKDQRIEELEEKLQSRIDKVDLPCGDALEQLWQKIMPENYGDWEYPGMAYRHLLAEFQDRDKRIAELEARIKRGQRRVDLLSGKRITEERGDDDG